MKKKVHLCQSASAIHNFLFFQMFSFFFMYVAELHMTERHVGLRLRYVIHSMQNPV